MSGERLVDGPTATHAPAPPRAGPPPAATAALGPVTALTATIALAAFAVAMAVAGLVVEPTPLPPPIEGTQRQGAETTLYLVTFLVVLPLSVLAVPRLADSIAARPNRDALPIIAAILAGAFAGAIVVARVLPGGVEALLAVVGAWWAGAVALLAAAARDTPVRALRGLARFTWVAWTATAVLLVASLLAFTSLPSVSPVAVALGAVAMGAVAAAAMRRAAPPRLSGIRGAAVDAVLVLLLLALVPDLAFLETDFARSVTQFHHNFYLGPANEVLAGGAMLVDTASQYGVGSIYFLSGWLGLTSIGYGMLGLLDGVLFALAFAAAFCVLRIAGASRLVAGAALAVAVVALLYNLAYPVGSLPQHGPLRFGLPLLVILGAVAAARWPRRRCVATAVQVVAVALASVWALEGFAFTLATFLAVASFEALTRPAPGKVRWLTLRVASALAACAAAHAVLAAATLAGTGELPDWGQYLAYLRAFLFGDLGELTYDLSRWSPGYAVGAAYLASAAALVLLLRRWPELARRRRPALVGLVATTAYGVVLFSYFVNRSEDHILPYVALPAVMAAAIWLTLLLDGSLEAAPPARLGGAVLSLAVAVLLTAVAWSSVGDRLSNTPLAHAIPGGESLRSAIDTLASPPALDPRSPAGERILDEHLPDKGRVPTLVFPDLETEVLVRSGRANALGLGYAREDSFVPHERLPGVEEALSRLAANDRILLQEAGLRAFDAYRADPERDPFRESVAPGDLAPAQEWALRWIAQRFDLRAVDRGEHGFVVVELAPRGGPEA